MRFIKVKNFRHAWLLLYFPVFITWFFLDERFIIGHYTTIKFWLDQYIPFIEYFVIPYVLWYPYLGIVGLFLLLRDENGFCRYMWALILGISFCLMFYIIFPNGQDLRPQMFLRQDIFTGLVGRLYKADTNLNVFPSIHIFGTLAPTVVIFKNREAAERMWVKLLSIIICVLICVSTVFIKQHSVVDVFSGAVLYIVVYMLIYRLGRNWRLWTWPAKPFDKGNEKGEAESAPI